MSTREPIIIGSSFWAVNGVNTFSARLARALIAQGEDVSLLLTESNTRRVTISDPLMPLPDDVPVLHLPVRPWESWGAAWGSLVRELRDRAPCVWLPNADFRHSCVSPRLPDDVIVAGIVYGNDPLHFDHVARLGRYWNTIVAVNAELSRETESRHPELASRICTIPLGVEVPATLSAHSRSPDGALQVAYVGSLTNYPKRVFELPLIVDKALAVGLSVRLTVIGGGRDEDELRRASTDLVRRGAMTFTGPLPPGRIAGHLRDQDALLLLSDFEGTPNVLLEAMAQGCIPVVSATANDAGLVRNGWNGFQFSTGDIAGAVHALQQLSGAAVNHLFRERAYMTVRDEYDIKRIATRYRQLFSTLRADVRREIFRRPPGELEPPPARIGVESIFPIMSPTHVPGVGRFLSSTEVEDYEEQIARRSFGSAVPVSGTVIVSVPNWDESGIHDRIHQLIRGLRRRGVDARLLITEAGEPWHQYVAAPDDIPVDTLTVLPRDGWGARWGATVRYFQDRAPIAWMPVMDWRHACVAPVLDDSVRLIGMAWDDSHCRAFLRWLAPHWDAIVSLSDGIRRELRRSDREFPSETSRLPDGDDMVEAYLDVLQRLADSPPARRNAARLIVSPPARLLGSDVFPEALAHRDPAPGAFPSAADAADFSYTVRRGPSRLEVTLARAHTSGKATLPSAELRDATIIVGVPTGNGAGTRADRLLHGLQSLGLDVRPLPTHGAPVEPGDDPLLPWPTDVPAGETGVALVDGRAVLADVHASKSPCIYFPTSEGRHADLIRELPPEVHAVAWAWEGDPVSMEAARRLAPYWSAVVVPYRATMRSLADEEPTLAERIAIIDDSLTLDEAALSSYAALLEHVLSDARIATVR